jgi:carbonic anhydrase
MNMPKESENIITMLQQKNKSFQKKYKNESEMHKKGQAPKIAILTCADSRVIPEYIFQASIGDLFVVRIAGNIAIDETVISSLEYAVDHLHITHLIILGHTCCGAVKVAEQTKETNNALLLEIQKSFLSQENHILANLTRQLRLLPQRSSSIKHAIEQEKLKLVAALYDIENGSVTFLD